MGTDHRPRADGTRVPSGTAHPASPAAGGQAERGRSDERGLASLDDALAASTDLDTLAEALLAYACRHAARSALFAVGRESLRWVAGRGRALEDPAADEIVLPLGGGTILDTALASRDFYYGVVPSLPPNRDLYSVLGGRIPPLVLLLPLRLRGRTVALLYLDEDDRPLTVPDLALMRRVAAKAGVALELLLLRRKLSDC